MNKKPIETSLPASPVQGDEAVMNELARRQRRLKWLAGMAVAFWSLAIVTSLGVLVFYPVFYEPKERQMLRDLGSNGHSTSVATAKDGGPPEVTPDSLRRELGNQFVMTYVITKGILLVAGSVVVLSCGTLATLLLVIFHRRVTLQQINQSLAQISVQLAEMRRGGGVEG